MTMTTEHKPQFTPGLGLPWQILRAEYRDNSGARDTIMPASFDPSEEDMRKWPRQVASVYITPGSVEKLEFILRACNSHDALLDACESLLDEFYTEHKHGDACGCDGCEVLTSARKLVAKLRSKVEETP